MKVLLNLSLEMLVEASEWIPVQGVKLYECADGSFDLVVTTDLKQSREIDEREFATKPPVFALNGPLGIVVEPGPLPVGTIEQYDLLASHPDVVVIELPHGEVVDQEVYPGLYPVLADVAWLNVDGVVRFPDLRGRIVVGGKEIK